MSQLIQSAIAAACGAVVTVLVTRLVNFRIKNPKRWLPLVAAVPFLVTVWYAVFAYTPHTPLRAEDLQAALGIAAVMSITALLIVMAIVERIHDVIDHLHGGPK